MPSVSLCRPRGGLRRVPAAILLAACAGGVKLFAGAPPDTAPTWARDVAPILMENCVECHRPDNVAPFPLLSYRDAAKRARFLAKTVTSRIMPPWSPAGPVGAFLGERRLTDEQIATIEHWAETGAASGDMTQAPAVPLARADGWHLGPPDVVVRMRRPFAIPAGPEDAYEVFPVPFSLDGVNPGVIAGARIPGTEMLAVAAVEIRPGNPRVFHHADVFVDTTGAARKRESAEGGNGYSSFGTPGFNPDAYLGGRVPGTIPHFLPPGIASGLMPATGDIVLQVHYHATGKAETDQSEVGIYFMREPANRVMDSLFLRSFRLDIPAGTPSFTVDDSIEIPADCILMSVFPHMHLLGREVHASARMPDGSTRPLLDIVRWSFRWQDHYYYREPFVLPKGTVVHCRWVFDNSAANPSNPFSPPRDVRFGPNATDEMCGMLLGVLPMSLDDAPLLAKARLDKMKENVAELSPEERSRFRWEDGFEGLSVR
jgi:mono/diheme cytochrome c family protein